MRYALILLSLLFSASVFANDTKPGRYFEDQSDVNDDFQIHLMYLLAKDSEDRGWDINGKISDIITKMNDQMFRATSANSKSGGIGKKYKLDFRKDGNLDITFIRLDKNEAELPRRPNNYYWKVLWRNNFNNPKKVYYAFADIETEDGGTAGVGMGSIFLKSKYNVAPDKDFTHITLHELMHTQGMGFPCIDGVKHGHIRSKTNMLGHGIELDENIYIHDIEGCPQLVDSVYLSPTSKNSYDPYRLVCSMELGRFNHPKLINIKENPGRYRREGVGCVWGRCLHLNQC